jgi:hypothetical protein
MTAYMPYPDVDDALDSVRVTDITMLKKNKMVEYRGDIYCWRSDLEEASSCFCVAFATVMCGVKESKPHQPIGDSTLSFGLDCEHGLLYTSS